MSTTTTTNHSPRSILTVGGVEMEMDQDDMALLDFPGRSVMGPMTREERAVVVAEFKRLLSQVKRLVEIYGSLSLSMGSTIALASDIEETLTSIENKTFRGGIEAAIWSCRNYSKSMHSEIETANKVVDLK